MERRVAQVVPFESAAHASGAKLPVRIPGLKVSIAAIAEASTL